MCAEGKFSSKDGSTSCQSNCPKGRFSSQTKPYCATCPLHYFSAQIGSAKCHRCPVGQHTTTSGWSRNHCAPGGHMTCAVGKFESKSFQGRYGCHSCPPGKEYGLVTQLTLFGFRKVRKTADCETVCSRRMCQLSNRKICFALWCNHLSCWCCPNSQTHVPTNWPNFKTNERSHPSSAAYLSERKIRSH